MDLFGDLPEPEQDSKEEDLSITKSKDVTTNAECSSPDPKQELGLKRKAEDKEIFEDGGTAKKTPVNEKVDKCEFELVSYVADRQGEREDMQDAHLIVDDFHTRLDDLHPTIKRVSVYAVFDGHGGVRASRFACQHLLTYLRDKFPKGDVTQVEKEIKKSLIEAFKKTDEDFLKEARKTKPSWKDGTTAVVVVVINDNMFIANLGDSKAVLCRYSTPHKKHVALPLTVDQSPSVYEERMRIQKAGGFVRDGRVMGQLEVSRSIGDGPFKNHGVTCVPDIKRCTLSEHDKFLIIACDGLWKQYTPSECIKTALESLECQDKKEDKPGYESVCQSLANSAVLRLSGDNVTVMIVSVTSIIKS